MQLSGLPAIAPYETKEFSFQWIFANAALVQFSNEASADSSGRSYGQFRSVVPAVGQATLPFEVHATPALATTAWRRLTCGLGLLAYMLAGACMLWFFIYLCTCFCGGSVVYDDIGVPLLSAVSTGHRRQRHPSCHQVTWVWCECRNRWRFIKVYTFGRLKSHTEFRMFLKQAINASWSLCALALQSKAKCVVTVTQGNSDPLVPSCQHED